jgi:hypothetical protein
MIDSDSLAPTESPSSQSGEREIILYTNDYEKYGGALDDILIELQIAHNGGVELLDSLVEVR